MPDDASTIEPSIASADPPPSARAFPDELLGLITAAL